jgi:hypothetical protein
VFHLLLISGVLPSQAKELAEFAKFAFESRFSKRDRDAAAKINR